MNMNLTDYNSFCIKENYNKTESEKAFDGLAKAIEIIDSNSFQFEYIQNGKEIINEARRLLYQVLSTNGYALNPNGKAYKMVK